MPLLILCSSPLTAADAPKKSDASATAVDPTVPKLTWNKVKSDGTQELAPELQDKTPGKATVIRKNPDGSQRISTLNSIDLKTFQGQAVYRSELPSSVRKNVTFVNFRVSGTPGEKVEDGSVINIDGAILGFQARQPSSRQPYESIRAQLMVRDLSPDGNLTWRAVNWWMSIDPQKYITVSAPIGVKLDHATNTWALYHNDLLVAENLPLFYDEKKPTVSVRAGDGPSDILELKVFKVSDKPKGRNEDGQLPATDGKIDFAKAVRENDPRLKPAGGFTFHPLEKKQDKSSATLAR